MTAKNCSKERHGTSSVPDLKLDALAIELDGADLEVDSDGGDEGWRERVVRETKQQAGLANTYMHGK